MKGRTARGRRGEKVERRIDSVRIKFSRDDENLIRDGGTRQSVEWYFGRVEKAR